MKKRIGTKLYDTETAIYVIPEKNLMRAQKNQTYFYFDGKEIIPVEYETARRLIIDSGKPELLELLSHKTNKSGQVAIMVSASSADHLSAYCRENGVTQKKVIEDFIATLPIKQE